MAENFDGAWRLRVVAKNAGFDQRFRVSGSAGSDGSYPGVVGAAVDVRGDGWSVELEWNDGAGSGWQPSGVLRSEGNLSPLVRQVTLAGDDSPPGQRDGDFDDLVVRAESLDPVFEVVQRPFAVDRGTLIMLPDGIFDASRGVGYMGVRIRSVGWFDWAPGHRIRIGIAPASRTDLGSRGIRVLDAWSTAEEIALQQTMDTGFVLVLSLPRGAARTVYLKLDVRDALPSKPRIRFVAQSTPWEPGYDAPSRHVPATVFVSRSTYDPSRRELVAELPEGRAFVRLTKVVADERQLRAALAAALAHPCERTPPRPGNRPSRREPWPGRLRLLRDATRGRAADRALGALDARAGDEHRATGHRSARRRPDHRRPARVRPLPLHARRGLRPVRLRRRRHVRHRAAERVTAGDRRANLRPRSWNSCTGTRRRPACRAATTP